MTRKIHLFGTALLCCVALAGSGCFLFGGGDGGGGGGDCSADSDCTDTQRCTDDNECVSKCQGVICNAGESCVPTTGACEPDTSSCTVDVDCGDATQRCSGGSCVAKCDGVICDTTRGETCEPTTGQCVGGTLTCSSDSDCLVNGQDLGRICGSGGECVGGEFGDCDGVSCDTGLDCLAIPTQSGNAMVCYTPCTASTDCTSPFMTCDQTAGSPTVNHCDQNLCSTDDLSQFGIQQSTFLGPCDASAPGAQDGTCFGLLAIIQGYEIGLCVADGPVAAGGTCDVNATHGDSTLCDSALCVPPTEGATQGTCRPFCQLLDGQECADISGAPTSCTLVDGLVGICWPQSASPAAVDAACTPSGDELVCVEDSVCADLTGGTNNTCHSWCDTRAPSCPGTQTCQALDPNSGSPTGICGA